MAADWIKMEVNVFEKKQVGRIMRTLGWDDPYAVVGRLLRIWSWADSETSTEFVKSGTLSDVDQLVSTPGFAKAMQEARWLKVLKTGIKFPGLLRHNGQSAKRRAEDARRKARKRASANCPQKSGQNADQTRRDERREEKTSKARISRGIKSSEQSTHSSARACPDALASPEDACVACRFPAELLRVVGQINGSPISPRRRQAAIDNAKAIAKTRNPMPIWRSIVKRAAARSKNPGGYIANAMADEAKETNRA